ncbi:hypothetical protein F5Y04DRAFT_103482 [Hypomontagnella monticulosa]|nr:hypothetical protein F5Y04DRAFT_103482 [Hypomontagnella monticulosa]
MELTPADGNIQTGGDQAQPEQIRAIFRNVDELVEAVLASNDALKQQNAVASDSPSLRPRQSALLKEFRDLMIAIQSKTSKAICEVETVLKPELQAELGSAIGDASLEDLAGVSQRSEVNRLLGCLSSSSKPSYKLRNFTANTPIPQLIIADDDGATVLPHDSEGPIVVLQPTLRNVWVVQHAYARLVTHKTDLIKQYLAAVDPSVGVNKKYLREYYEDPGLANLPSKSKLGNLLDVKMSSQNHATHDMMIILVFTDINGNSEYVEAVGGDAITIDYTKEYSPYLILPATEGSIRMLYDTYRSLRKVTADKRRATKDKEFAATLPIDAMAALEAQFSFAENEKLGGKESTNTKKKRRRMLDDDE